MSFWTEYSYAECLYPQRLGSIADAFLKAAKAGERTRYLIIYFLSLYRCATAAPPLSPMLRSRWQGILTEGEGSVQLTSTLK
jgi:hypothetical protein